MNNIAYKISSHKIEGDKIVFFHKVKEIVKGEDGLYKYTNNIKEEKWFDVKFYDWSEVSLTSKSRIYYGVPSCSELEVMDYFKRNRIGKLKTQKELDNYDTDPYGREYKNGKYVYEVWDLSELFK